MEELLARHRKEQRDLQSQVTQKKKAATKKTRKGVNDECEFLERELRDRHVAEIAATSGGGVAGNGNAMEELREDNDEVDDQKSTRADQDETVEGNTETAPAAQRKPNRQKARLARRGAERDAVATQAAEESLSIPDLRKREKDVMDAEIQRRGLQEKEIQADGHCLYNAVASSLKEQKINLRPLITTSEEQESEEPKVQDYKWVRRMAAEYIKGHEDDFAPFLEEPLDQYVRKVGETAEWGGQLELLALAKAYGVDIAVLQGDGRVVDIESGEQGSKKVWLAYYKHNFRLGEHYNSLRAVG